MLATVSVVCFLLTTKQLATMFFLFVECLLKLFVIKIKNFF